MNKHITMEEYKTEFLSQYVIELTKWIMRKFGYDEKNLIMNLYLLRHIKCYLI